jgi:O-antigen/teichoic acid export membrane protein
VLAIVWSILSGPVSVYLIAKRFSGEVQGYYYTISSLLSLQIFFELGLSNVLTVFSSHEFAKLKWGEGGDICGDPGALARISDLLKKTIKWFGTASALLTFLLIPFGLLFFGHKEGLVAFSWRLPWTLAVLGTALKVFISSFFSIIMGSGDVIAVNRRNLLVAVIGSCTSWVIIWFHGGLYAISAVSLSNAVFSYCYLLKLKPRFLVFAYRSVRPKLQQLSEVALISWREEIWPMQWKIAVSWISGYFIFQLFNPVLFYFHGATAAGQMGMTLIASNALLGVSIVLINAKNPEFGRLISLRDWTSLDRIFNKVLAQSLLISATGAFLGWLAVYLLQQNFAVGARFLPASQAALLFVSMVIITAVYGYATYLRAHMKEVLMKQSVIAALLQGTATLVLGWKFSSLGMVLGYFGLNVIYVFPSIYYIRRHYKELWHRETHEETVIPELSEEKSLA